MKRTSSLSARVAITVLASVTLAVGCGSGSGRVSPQDYVKGVCNSAKSFVGSILSTATSLQKALTPGSTPSEGKTAIEGVISILISATDKLKADLGNLGTPDVGNGAQVKAALDSAFSEIGSRLQKEKADAANLPTSSPQAFLTAAQQLSGELRSTFTNPLSSSLSHLKAPELKAAAQKEPACRSGGANPGFPGG